jgi:hypothetical protein
MGYQGERPQQMAWIESKERDGNDALLDYVVEHNATSIDGLPAFESTILPGTRLRDDALNRRL